MLGDRVSADANFVATFEAVASVPPAVLRPWLEQAMRGAGMYGWSRLDGPRSRSSRQLLEGIPAPRVGDRLDGLFEICRLDARSEIVWRNLVPLSFLDSTIEEVTLDYRVRPTRPDGSRLTARLRCVIDARAGSMSNHAAGVLAYILPYCQVNALTQYAELERRARRVPVTDGRGTRSFQHVVLTGGSRD